MKINVEKRDKRILLTQDALGGQGDVWELTELETRSLWLDLGAALGKAICPNIALTNYVNPSEALSWDYLMAGSHEAYRRAHEQRETEHGSI